MKSSIILTSALLFGGYALGSSPANINERRTQKGANDGQPVTFTKTETFRSSIRTIAGIVSTSYPGIYIPDEKNVNVRALKDFQKRFIDASNVRWFSDGSSFLSCFISNGYPDRAFYDKKGRWMYSLLYYNEEKLPEEVREAVKSAYSDLTITVAEEVQTTSGIGYIIHLEDKSNIKILKVSPYGEMETIMDLVKYPY